MKLDLYVRQDCHLCSDFIQALSESPDSDQIEVNILDVDERPEWQKAYGYLVPVLMADNTEICHYFFDQLALNQYYLAR